MARFWFRQLRLCGDDVRELLHDGCPTACVNDAAFAYVNVFASHVNLGFYAGADLRDPQQLLEGTGKRMRHIKLRPDDTFDEAAIKDLIHAAYLDIRNRLNN